MRRGESRAVLDNRRRTRPEVSVAAVFLAFLKLGLTSFGGPIAHLGYFREEFVTRRKWIDDRAYADLVALCQFTPGPASSKVGIGIGLAKAGLSGAFAAWLAFTLPSAVALVLFAYGVQTFAADLGAGWLHGLKVVAVAVVAQAVWGMARNLTPDAPRVHSRDHRSGHYVCMADVARPDNRDRFRCHRRDCGAPKHAR